MSLQQLRNVDFGLCYAGFSGSVGYTIYDVTGSTVIARTTSGVYQTVTGSGIYNAYITFPDRFNGSIVWDATPVSGSNLSTAYAAEQYNYEENNPRVDDIYNVEYGRWRIVSDQMIFFKEDNVTEVARFDLFDENGLPTVDAVFERRRV